MLTHEFGHALACRSVGGRADRILLWPLGGVAFVSPPQRPGAVLWSIAAGPLVNVVLLPVTIGAYYLVKANGPFNPDVRHFLFMVAAINVVLLVFNMLPIYPLDGGQILRALLWFFIGEGRSLMVASVIGLAGAVAGMVFALMTQDLWLIVLAGFAAMQSWIGFQRSRAIRLVDAAPRRQEVRCPRCGTAPPVGPLWTCQCGQAFDTFETGFRCPRCGGVFMTTTCPTCRQPSPPAAWSPPGTGSVNGITTMPASVSDGRPLR